MRGYAAAGPFWAVGGTLRCFQQVAGLEAPKAVNKCFKLNKCHPSEVDRPESMDAAGAHPASAMLHAPAYELAASEWQARCSRMDRHHSSASCSP
eukprot:10625916-Alexandrium_andersonii.AAC.1